MDMALPRYDEGALEQRSFMTRVYGWMSGGLLVTALVALLTAQSRELQHLIFATRGTFLVLVIAEVLLVLGITALINRMSATLATGLFLLYSALNGLTLSVILLLYAHESIASAFMVTAGTFGAMSIWGWITKKDLTSLGSFCTMALLGLVLASLVSLFFHSTILALVINCAGVLIFVALTAYDTQKIKMMYLVGRDGSQEYQKAAILGALTLYLDFINLFLFILRLLGDRRRD